MHAVLPPGPLQREAGTYDELMRAPGGTGVVVLAFAQLAMAQDVEFRVNAGDPAAFGPSASFVDASLAELPGGDLLFTFTGTGLSVPGSPCVPQDGTCDGVTVGVGPGSSGLFPILVRSRRMTVTGGAIDALEIPVDTPAFPCLGYRRFPSTDASPSGRVVQAWSMEYAPGASCLPCGPIVCPDYRVALTTNEWPGGAPIPESAASPELCRATDASVSVGARSVIAYVDRSTGCARVMLRLDAGPAIVLRDHQPLADYSGVCVTGRGLDRFAVAWTESALDASFPARLYVVRVDNGGVGTPVFVTQGVDAGAGGVAMFDDGSLVMSFLHDGTGGFSPGIKAQLLGPGEPPMPVGPPIYLGAGAGTSRHTVAARGVSMLDPLARCAVVFQDSSNIPRVRAMEVRPATRRVGHAGDVPLSGASLQPRVGTPGQHGVRYVQDGRLAAVWHASDRHVYATVRALPFTPFCRGDCAADTDDGSGTGVPDGGLTIDDLLHYLAMFEQGDLCADVDDGSGAGVSDGGVTIDDLLHYLAMFEAGCA